VVALLLEAGSGTYEAYFYLQRGRRNSDRCQMQLREHLERTGEQRAHIYGDCKSAEEYQWEYESVLALSLLEAGLLGQDSANPLPW
jgi:hypothetical protein